MNLSCECILYAQDEELSRRITAYLASGARIQRINECSRVATALQTAQGVILILDLAADGARDLLERFGPQASHVTVIALGLPNSDPFRNAEDLGAFAVEPCDVDRRRLQATVRKAQAVARLGTENRLLQERLQQQAADTRTRPDERPAEDPRSLSLAHFSRVFRHFQNVQSVCENIVEGLCENARTTRAGLFCLNKQDKLYSMRAGIKCLEDARNLTVADTAPFVQWMQLHAHVISRPMLSRTTQPEEEIMLRRMLDALGAEVIVPLHGREALLGWFFLGHRATGAPFTDSELENVMLLGESISLTLENAVLYEEVAVQKTLAETVLHSIPVGIVAVDARGIVRWCNPAAEHVLEIAAGSALNRPLSMLDGNLVDLLTRSLRAEAIPPGPHEWRNALNQRILSAEAQRLVDHDDCLGAVVFIHDLTQQRLLREKQDRLDRATFWTELAAAISHEVRNPLVAINTFAQLLPERYDDTEFRTEFRELATREIARLDRMVDQINAFANPPELNFQPLHIEKILAAAVNLAQQRSGRAQIPIQQELAPGIPPIEGDESALTECFAHLIGNACEALGNASAPSIRLSAEAIGNDPPAASLMVRVQDNGPGFKPDIREKAFSPFCSSKARGIGLGLPIAQRAVTDHNGHLHLDTSRKGTTVTVVLPTVQSSPEGAHETHPGS